jgi:hypothetical protein
MWKKIEGWSNYEVSDCGMVRRIACTIRYPQGFDCFYKERLIKPEKTRSGYLRVTLSEFNKQKRYMVHRLVALHFLKNPSRKPHVNHIDGNPSNNNASNLEWCTPSENELHSYNVLGKLNPIRKLTDEQAAEIRAKRGVISSRLLAHMYGVNKKTVLNIWNNVCYIKAVPTKGC